MRTVTVNGITAEYTVKDDEYIIHSIARKGGLEDGMYMDMFYEAIDEDIAQDAGEHEAERLLDRYDSAL
jgi:hypothetical protein